MITTGWSYLRVLFDEADPIPKIVIARNSTNYLKPVVSDFTTELTIPDEKTRNHFFEMFERFGKARITLKVQIRNEQETLAEFEGEFVALSY